MKNGFCTTIVNVQRSGWMLYGFTTLSKAETPSKEIYGDCLVDLTWFNSPQLYKTRRNHHSGEYCREIDEIHQKLARNRPPLVNRKGSTLLHDNARAHASMIIRQKLHTLDYEVLDHLPYSPDLSPTDFHFLKHLDKSKCFRNLKYVETAFNEFVAPRTITFMIPA